MITVKVRPRTTTAIADLQRILNQTVRLISQDLFNTVKQKTPKRSGRARNDWRLRQVGQVKAATGNNVYQLKNTQPYISRLDTGYSKQAPEGFTRPAFREVARRQKGKRR